MYIFAYCLLLLAEIVSLGTALLAIVQLLYKKQDHVAIIERMHYLVSLGFVGASSFLLYALWQHDYRLDYVASYTDNVLPIFYRLTAFWAGQPGSMLFWALSVAIMGSFFAWSKGYKRLPATIRLWFWVFFFTVTAFFAVLLTVWSNPFSMTVPAPLDGRGLNPLLQNPGMIFHPPLLFLGYGGFTVPSCLALAQAIGNDEPLQDSSLAWHRVSRGIMIWAWCFLTAGIILGAWWAYMELGWGGYWAWDPVENASLIPWLIGTAALHTLIIERRSKKLVRSNIMLIALTTISGFFATYLVRSGVIDSVHAFGQGPVGKPLLLFIGIGLVIAIILALFAKGYAQEREEDRSLDSILSAEGLIVLSAWVLLALGIIIVVATMWPVLSLLWSQASRGLDAGFYNKVCLPLATVLIGFMAICPWLGKEGMGKKFPAFALSVFVGLLFAGGAFWLGYRLPLALVAQVCAGAVAFGILMSVFAKWTKKTLMPVRLEVMGAHLGVALCAIGIAFSGPYKIEHDFPLKAGQTVAMDVYSVTLQSSGTGRQADYEYLRAVLELKNAQGEVVAVLAPEKRAYDKFQGMLFSEVDVNASFGKEIYASVSGIDNAGNTVVKISIEPLVSWLWLGGTVMSLCPLFYMLRRRKTSTD